MADGASPRAVEMLVAEHAQGRVFLDPMAVLALPAPDDGAAIEALLELVGSALAYFEDDLEEHIAKEEEAFFPPFEGRLSGSNSALIDEFLAEHDQIRMHRDELEAALDDLLSGHDDIRDDRDSLRAAIDRFAASRDGGALAALVDEARRIAMIAQVHFENEEELLFPLAPLLLTADELEATAAAMDAIGERYASGRAV